MNILEFIQKFPDEGACRLKFKEQRDQIGIICDKCNCKEHYWHENKLCYECKHCHRRISLRSGTVMQSSKLPFRYWFVTMHLLTCTKKSFSTEELRRQIGHKRYQPIWEMVNKLRDVMGKRDNKYQLSGQMELDDAFFSTEIPQDQKDKPMKRGRGSQSKSKVLVMAESTFVDAPKKGHKLKSVKHIKMQVINDLKSNTITNIVKEQVDKSAQLITDNSTSYYKLKEHVQSHEAVVVEPDMIPTLLPWVHIAISNAKRLLLDVHHKLKNEYLQYYLNEYCYKFNRRYFGDKIFDRLLIAAVSYSPDFKSKIYNRTLCG
jgi:hypothetical protein